MIQDGNLVEFIAPDRGRIDPRDFEFAAGELGCEHGAEGGAETFEAEVSANKLSEDEKVSARVTLAHDRRRIERSTSDIDSGEQGLIGEHLKCPNH